MAYRYNLSCMILNTENIIHLCINEFVSEQYLALYVAIYSSVPSFQHIEH